MSTIQKPKSFETGKNKQAGLRVLAEAALRLARACKNGKSDQMWAGCQRLCRLAIRYAESVKNK